MGRKNNRPDVTYPCPDPEKEPPEVLFFVGQQVRVKPDVFYQGINLGAKIGSVKSIASYIEVEIDLWEKWIDPKTEQPRDGWVKKTLKFLRYEVEPFPDDLWNTIKF